MELSVFSSKEAQGLQICCDVPVRKERADFQLDRVGGWVYDVSWSTPKYLEFWPLANHGKYCKQVNTTPRKNGPFRVLRKLGGT